MSTKPEHKVLPIARAGVVTGGRTASAAAPAVLAAAEQAWQKARHAAGSALRRPVRSAALNRALRQHSSPEPFRAACSALVSPVPFEDMMRISRAASLAFDLGRRHGWPALGDRRRQFVLPHAPNDAAYFLHTLVRLHYLNQAVQEWFGDARDIPDEAWSDEVELQVFSSWRTKALRRRLWPALSPEDRALLVRPAIELVFHQGLYLAMQARARAAHGRPWFWHYRAGRHCRRHDELDGLRALPGDPVWRHALPPLSFFCDCWIEMLRAPAGGAREDGARHAQPGGARPESAQESGPARCSFFRGRQARRPEAVLQGLDRPDERRVPGGRWRRLRRYGKAALTTYPQSQSLPSIALARPQPSMAVLRCPQSPGVLDCEACRCAHCCSAAICGGAVNRRTTSI